MIHIALRIAYALFLAWLGSNVLLFIAIGVLMFLSRRSAAKEAQELLDEADALVRRLVAHSDRTQSGYVSPAREDSKEQTPPVISLQS